MLYLAFKFINMSAASSSLTDRASYVDLYKYLLFLTEEQITKLARIAIGTLSPSAFSEEEIGKLENQVQQQSLQSVG